MKEYELGVMLREEEADQAKKDIVRSGARIAGKFGDVFTYAVAEKEFELTFEFEETVSDYCIEFKRIR